MSREGEPLGAGAGVTFSITFYYILLHRGERVPGNGNGNAGNRPIRFRRISDYDPFLDMDSLIAQIPCLVGSSQPLLLVYTVLHKGWISEQIVSVPGVRS